MLKHKVPRSTMMLAMVYPHKVSGFPRSGFMILTRMSLSGTSHVTLPPEDHPRYKSLMAREKL
ncbi:MAG: hypothetical protein CMA52_01940, partial [Euryarchaeota archaeon]|nr:hypothetical protein [Euryarchaeota archaeon]